MKLLVIFDIDGTCANVGDRFKGKIPKPQERSNPDYLQYLKDKQTRDKLMKDVPVSGMQKMIEAFPNAIYLTSRERYLYKDTVDWLSLHNFPEREIYMRDNGDSTLPAKYKEMQIKQLAHLYPNIILVDDDDDMLEMCQRNGWTFLQARSGGKVPK